MLSTLCGACITLIWCCQLRECEYKIFCSGLIGTNAFPSIRHSLSDCVIAEHTDGDAGGAVTAVGIPVMNQKSSLFPGAPSVGNNRAQWPQDNILDTSHDHLLRPPAA